LNPRTNTKNQVYHAMTKHIDVRFHFVQEILDEGDIELLKVYTKENPFGTLTKMMLYILPVA